MKNRPRARTLLYKENLIPGVSAEYILTREFPKVLNREALFKTLTLLYSIATFKYINHKLYVQRYIKVLGMSNFLVLKYAKLLSKLPDHPLDELPDQPKFTIFYNVKFGESHNFIS